VYVEGLSEWVVKTPSEIYGLMERGASQRATGSTKMNELSSRSHAVRAFPNHRAPPSRLRILVPEGTITSDCLRNTRYERLTLSFLSHQFRFFKVPNDERGLRHAQMESQAMETKTPVTGPPVFLLDFDNFHVVHNEIPPTNIDSPV